MIEDWLDVLALAVVDAVVSQLSVPVDVSATGAVLGNAGNCCGQC